MKKRILDILIALNLALIWGNSMLTGISSEAVSGGVLAFIINVPMVTAIIAGIICGITGGIIYKLNFNQGGISIINTLLHTYLKIKIPITNFIVNTTIMLIGSIYFGFIKLIYSLIVISISNLIINSIMSKKKLTKKLT